MHRWKPTAMRFSLRRFDLFCFVDKKYPETAINHDSSALKIRRFSCSKVRIALPASWSQQVGFPYKHCSSQFDVKRRPGVLISTIQEMCIFWLVSFKKQVLVFASWPSFFGFLSNYFPIIQVYKLNYKYMFLSINIKMHFLVWWKILFFLQPKVRTPLDCCFCGPGQFFRSNFVDVWKVSLNSSTLPSCQQSLPTYKLSPFLKLATLWFLKFGKKTRLGWVIHMQHAKVA